MIVVGHPFSKDQAINWNHGQGFRMIGVLREKQKQLKRKGRLGHQRTIRSTARLRPLPLLDRRVGLCRGDETIGSEAGFFIPVYN